MDERATGPGTIRIGTAAWSDHVDFYPPGLKPSDRITFYANQFQVVEVNASYYAILPVANYASWVEKTPDDFTMNVKALGQLTGHVRGEQATPELFQAFRDSYHPLRDAGKLGAVLFQFPPWFEATPVNREYIAWCADMMHDDHLLIEFRNVTWMHEDARESTLSLIRDMGATYVTTDAPQTGTGTTPLVPAVTNRELAYLRLHGRNVDTWYAYGERGGRGSGGRFDYSYSDDELQELAGIAAQLASDARTLHIIFNNNVRGQGIRNARTIMRLLGMDVPEGPPVQAKLDL